MTRLAGTVAIVTGAGRGVRREIARHTEDRVATAGRALGLTRLDI